MKFFYGLSTYILKECLYKPVPDYKTDHYKMDKDDGLIYRVKFDDQLIGQIDKEVYSYTNMVNKPKGSVGFIRYDTFKWFEITYFRDKVLFQYLEPIWAINQFKAGVTRPLNYEVKFAVYLENILVPNKSFWAG